MERLQGRTADIWETIASCFQFRLKNRWNEDTDKSWKTSWSPWSRKSMASSQCAVSVRLQCCRLFTVSTPGRCSDCRERLCNTKMWSRVRSRFWSAGSRSGVNAQTGGGTGYGVANSGLRDGLRCGCCIRACDHTTKSSKQR